MISSGRLFWTTLLAAVTTTAIGCESVVTEYHRRSSFYRMASEVELEQRAAPGEGGTPSKTAATLQETSGLSKSAVHSSR